jgi:S-(hydroxymethyl)glutathione dehydrogenase/alcohol dehydrogenase
MRAVVMPIRSTRAAILAHLHRPLVVDSIALPEQLTPGQVLVRMHSSGICGSQLGEIDGVKGPDPFLPHLLGHEGSGEVVAIGPAVSRVRIGDRVVLHWRKGPGIESATPRYGWNGTAVNAGWVTTLCEYAVVSENRLTPIGADFDASLAALLGCPVTTGLGVVCNDARLRPGESLVVLGAGGVGSSVVMAARLVSAYPIVAVDRTAAKLALARQCGATHVLLTDRRDLEADLREIVAQPGADVAVDHTGTPAMIRLAYDITQPDGRTILVGVPQAEAVALPTLPLHFGKQLTGSHGGSSRPERDIPRCLALYRRRQLPLDHLITHRCHLDEVNDAIERMRRGEIAGRCVVEFQ